jgi:two-component system sensor histidine kinase DesK
VTVQNILARDHDPALIVAQLAGLALFVAVFVWLATHQPFGEPLEVRWVFPVLVGIAVAVAVLSPGEGLLLGTTAALAGGLLPRRSAIVLISVLALLTAGSVLLDGRTTGALPHGIQTAAIGLFCFGWARLQEANTALADAREQVARLAVAQERGRFARDLHDLLGHTLSVIRVKAELGARLVDTDPVRAGSEMAEVEAVARSALVEVQAAVDGYHPDLAVELERAGAALGAAGIAAVIDAEPGQVTGRGAEVLAWVAREAATNVVRHSDARRCRIGIERNGSGFTMVVEDDGVGLRPGAPAGRGLAGMRERLAEVGGTLALEHGDVGGLRVRAVVPGVPS